MASDESKYYHAIIDMGSNGIRFSITNLSPSTARSMPTVYLDRAGISLYDAQYSATDPHTRVAIPDVIINRVIASLVRFKRTCVDFGVPEKQVRFIATEATRTATNSAEFRAKIKEKTGWEVEMLPKEEEGRVGAMGVASSFPIVKGLVMDLGGGSTQLTWLMSRGDGKVDMPEGGSVSMPYGAAALTRRLAEANAKKTRKALHDEISTALQDAMKVLSLPKELQDSLKSENGLSLYLSGGGFRGWGFVLMSQHPISPYPIPIINGFQTTTKVFHNVSSVQLAVQAAASDDAEGSGIFRVSDRRASQVPAVGFLVSCLAKTLPAIDKVHFCQGGVREGAIFSTLSPEVRSQHPLVVASEVGAPRSAEKVLSLLDSLLAKTQKAPYRIPAVLTPQILRVVVNTLHTHAPMSKDLRAASALRCTTTGHLAAVHGVSHLERAVLALTLCERWGGRGSLSPADTEFYDQLVQLVALDDDLLAWWCLFIGRAAAFLGEAYPAGVVGDGNDLQAFSRWTTGGEVMSEINLSARASTSEAVEGVSPQSEVGESVLKALRKFSRCGKKKNWYGGRGFKVYMSVQVDEKRIDLEKIADEGEDF
ncbi:Ppx-GppA-domain-containing protein [Rhizodiscina lignyota]|uniref:Ppx-GppA-domain-containing protein n=1 Tax=Rhizodiscina lignyota TaxID=1504668 RepID=A0A9P4IJ63_9PEZI|nr:Ppx-GppA-domain-containing protein [Rhizodiscina lignyota]